MDMVGSRRIFTKDNGILGGARDNSSFENLFKNIEHIDANTYATHARDFYKLINRKSHIVGKSYTYTVEGTNLILRHYLARFARKTYFVSKCFPMIIYSLYLFCFKYLLPSIIFLHYQILFYMHSFLCFSHSLFFRQALKF